MQVPVVGLPLSNGKRRLSVIRAESRAFPPKTNEYAVFVKSSGGKDLIPSHPLPLGKVFHR